MIKKILIVGLVALTATGCATRAGTAALIGGTVGYVVGSSQPRPVVVQQHQPRTYTETQIIVDRRAQCDHHNRRIASCARELNPITRNNCRNYEIANYERCLYQ